MEIIAHGEYDVVKDGNTFHIRSDQDERIATFELENEALQVWDELETDIEEDGDGTNPLSDSAGAPVP